MLNSIILNDFKSFEGKNTIPIKQLSTLIGLNSSGKTNVLEGLVILSNLVSGTDITAYFNNYSNFARQDQLIRGGAKGCCRGKKKSFTLGCISSSTDGYNLEYQITINVSKEERIVVESESLFKILGGSSKQLIFKTIKGNMSSGDINVEYNNHKRGPNPRLTINKNSSVISQIEKSYTTSHISNYEQVAHLIESSNKKYIRKADLSDIMKDSTPLPELLEQTEIVRKSLSKIKSLNPIPERMRNYVSRNAGPLQSDASNLSSVLSTIFSDHYRHTKRSISKNPRNDFISERIEKNEKIYQKILEFINLLPEYTINGLKILTTPAPLRDVMFACIEERSSGDDLIMPASLLSDGLLRITALAVAVLTSENSSILLLDEFDSALHESKTLTLLEKIQEYIKKTDSMVILTTHDTPLLNNYTSELLAGTIIVFRNKQDNKSNCINFYDLNNVDSLVIKGGLGEATLKNGLQPYLNPKDSQNKVSSIPSWLSSEVDQ
ncbi:DNA replication and repair protein RecF [Lactiplantibacillus plantarum]|uniref:AAA family ATPase n=1 Tax=Lactiplantibacillus plantarum TaxID=1590 RepID=UPI00106AA405|nr:AAA family ATPase [Lactiplantibacillus plantarum]VFI64356.1 DNA replication and repair protein RecF [Lactiplantibacillus plantarum]VFI64399.1 DNA replication and repair protein RecF [Lactiplantibacillus plantarum]